MPMISVIVPVYNTEKYLRNCVESVLNQTFSDFELILVDDGSPDNCGAICDEYAAKDPRVQVIHQENGGVAAARNTGLLATHAEYILFVDSDDWIAPEMAEDMLRALLENRCDMAICQYYTVRGKNVICRTSGDQGIRVLGQREAIRLLVQDRLVTNHLWRCLFRKTLFSRIRFPEGKTYEDIYVMTDIMLQCQRIVYLDKAYYYYFTNDDGIIATKSVPFLTDYLDAVYRQSEVVRNTFPDLMAECYSSFCKKLTSLLRDVLNIPARAEGKTVLLRRILDGLAAIPPAARYTREDRFCCFTAQFPIPVFLVSRSLYLSARRLFRALKAAILPGKYSAKSKRV